MDRIAYICITKKSYGDMNTPHPLYNEFSFFLKRHFPYKVQKISLHAGFTCPNRDVTLAW